MTMETRLYQAVVCLLFAVATSAGWTRSLNRKALQAEEIYSYPWVPSRRSEFATCARTNERCVSTAQCCYDHDVCVSTVMPFKKYDLFGVEHSRRGFCQDMRKVDKYSRHLKPSGQQCQDSMECRDHCCREVRGFRSRYYVCGTPADDALAYTCIKAARSENDVLDYLV
ncbi:uncharacterized protein LOC112557834 [Pomacea canaliculata]|uniref:uncharacterized protein LOC112557834 n=1 Tax=Pomacea canaliculata TaxID=400727 RepID=UPI000D7291FA|nr:uncharacterized protein LOC112557834 [Pomacea canaliculata]